MVDAAKSGVQPAIVIDDRAPRVDVERGAVLGGEGREIDVFAVEGTVFVGKAVHRGPELAANPVGVKRRT